MPTLARKEADAHDRMLDAAMELYDLIARNAININADDLEEVTIFLARMAPQVRAILRPVQRSRCIARNRLKTDL